MMPLSPPAVDVARELLAGGVGTPFLAVDRDALRTNIARWRRHLPDVRPHYAVKANVDPLVLRELFAAGADADVASAYEVNVCRALGLGGDRMILSNPRKDPYTVATLRDARPWATTVDSVEEVEKLADAGVPGGGYDPVLFARIKVPTRGVTQDLSSKFGVRVVAPGDDTGTRMQLSEVRAVFARAREAGFGRLGLAFHVGTQCADPDVYAGALRVCRAVAAGLREDGTAIEWIDIGGGFADARTAAVRGPFSGTASGALDQLLAGIGRACREAASAGFGLVAEPGRYVVADAGFLVTRVIYDRDTAATGRRVQIDDGVFRTLSGRIHDDREFRFHPFRADPAAPPFLPAVARFAVWGCSCDSFDKVADDAPLPADLSVGDCLLAECAGAYSTSFGSNTNGFAPAPVVMFWRDGTAVRWEVSPLARQNDLLLDHVRHWVGAGASAQKPDAPRADQ